MSARIKDINDFIEIKGNPISKVGVFQYAGWQISDELEPDQIYNVYRPEEELNNEECISSFKLVPFIDDHAMLGSGSGFTPAEKKGIDGTTGETVYFEAPFLKSNIKIFSSKLAENIDKDGKKDLSIGYRCRYELTPGVFDGVAYQAIQREIRGNHLARVSEGRSGPEVSVLDHFKFTFDSKELLMSKESIVKKKVEDEGELTMETLSTRIEAILKMIKGMSGNTSVAPGATLGADEDTYENTENTEGDVEEVEAEVEQVELTLEQLAARIEEIERMLREKFSDTNVSAAADEDTEKKEEKKKDTTDSARTIRQLSMDMKELRKAVSAKSIFEEVAKRDALAKDLARAGVGTFDHSAMTYDGVVDYGIKKLKLSVGSKGHERSVLAGYLAAAKKNAVTAVTMDSSYKPNDQIEALLNSKED